MKNIKKAVEKFFAFALVMVVAITTFSPTTTHAATITSNNLTTQKSTVQGKRIYLSLQLTSYGTYWNPDVYGWQIKGPNGYNQTFPIYRTVNKNQTLTNYVDVPYDGSYTIQAFVKAYNSSNYSYDTIWSYNGDSVVVGNSNSFSPIYPVSGYYSTWNGNDHSTRWGAAIDIKCSTGTAVRATESGKVTINDLGNTSFGKVIYIKHSNGKESVYAHLSSFSVVNGQSVSRGQIIGYSGNSGRSSGPHLHFELQGYSASQLLNLPR